MQSKIKKSFAAVLASVLVLSSLSVLDAGALTTISANCCVTEPTEKPVGALPDKSESTAFGTDDNIKETSVSKPTEAQTTNVPVTSAPEYVSGAVQNLRLDGNYTDRLIVKWDRLIGADGYRVYYHTNTSDNEDYEFVAQGNNDYAVIYNLKPNSVYYVKVTAYVIKDGKKIEGEAALKTFSTALVPTVTGLRISDNYTDRLVVKWNRAPMVSGYRVYFRDNTTSEDNYKFVAQGNNDYAVIYNLKPNSVYYVKVTAFIIKDGKIVEGDPASKTFSTAIVPAVTGLRISDNYPDRLIVKWNRAPRVSGYKVYFRDDATAEGNYKFVAQGNNDYAVIYNLKPNSKYHVKVVTFTDQNGVRYESEAACSTLSTIPIPIVQNIRNTSSYTDRIILKWDRVKGASGYKVYCCDGEGLTQTYNLYAQGNNDYAVIYNLKAGNRYFFKVSAFVNYGGINYEGNINTKRTATQPAAVTGLTMVNTSKHYLQFSWNRNPNATGYKIYRSSYKSNGEYVLYKTIDNNQTTTFKDTAVEEGRGYYYCVRAYRNANNTTYHSDTNYIRLVCGLTGPDFSLTSQLSTVTLSWNKNPNAGGYEIFYATSKNGKYHYYDYTKGTSFTTGKLSVGKTYYFRVRPYLIHGSREYKIVGDYYTKSVTVTKTFKGNDYGDTFILISIDQQHMWYYLDGELYCETDVVTGNADGYYNTPRGQYRIYSKARCTYLNGPGYSSYVDYWMAFNGDIGIHDASWRSSFGGNIYKGNGSHGCVNTPFNAAKDIYNHASIGTRVIVY